MACAIPLTLAMAVGMMALLGMEIQQVSITSLIIALGLLVDDPVVAGDAIKRELLQGRRPGVAAWLGPTRLGTAIAFATVTNIVAYLPFLILKGDTGRFLYALPVVMTCALVASRIVSMTFVPLLGYYLLRVPAESQEADERPHWFPTFYRRVVGGCIRHRKIVAVGSLLFPILGGLLFLQIKQSFFPYDSQYLSYIDIHLPEDASLAATNRAALSAERIIEDVTAKYGAEQGTAGKPKRVLVSLSTFVGSGSPRFWFTLFPQQPEPNYAMIIMQVTDKPDTLRLQPRLQDALSAGVPGARIDVHMLETGRPIGIPVAVRVTGDDPAQVRRIADSVAQIYRGIPTATRVRDDWGASGLHLEVRADPVRASLSGITEQDIADATDAATAGRAVGVLREGDTQIPIIARLRLEDRARLGDLDSLYVYPSQGGQAVPIGQVAKIVPRMEAVVLRRRNQFPCITVSCFPTAGHLASDVDGAARAGLDRLRATLPPGYQIEQGGEIEEQQKAFLQLVAVLAVSVVCIYLALTFEFKNAVKPLLVFAAVPYGVIGAVIGLRVMNEPFGFMAFLGIISLVGVLVSHIIVLFDFIEAARKRGEALETALLEAGVQRLRPILVTVGATVIAFFPLALHGGPLWEPLCYAQIGGLCVGALTTLLLVPTLYTIFVRDWRIVKWDQPESLASVVGDRSPSPTMSASSRSEE
jgi:multidrug efflux pump subunit AcrB